MPSTHARLGSSNTRWPHCSGSIREEANYPDDSSSAAIDGTGSHLLFEKCITQLRRADSFLTKTICDDDYSWVVKQDRVNRVQQALDYVWQRYDDLGATDIEAEAKVNPGRFFDRDDWWGTCDVTLISPTTLEIIDYKDGRMFVDANNNDQLTDYAAGRLLPYLFGANKHGTTPDFKNCPFKTIRMTIIQPKTSPVVRYEEVTPEELYRRILLKHYAAIATDDPNAPLVAGKWCQWCKHGRAGNCDAKNKEGMEGMSTILATSTNGQSDFISMITEGTLDMSKIESEKLSAILDVSKSVEKLIKLVNEEALCRIQETPGSIPGYVLGEGRSKYVWNIDQDAVVKRLTGMRMKKEEVMIPTLITPAAARRREEFSDRQKLNLEKLIDKVPGKPSLKRVKTNDVKDLFAGVESTPISDNPKINFM